MKTLLKAALAAALALSCVAASPFAARAELSELTVERAFGIAYLPLMLMERDKLLEKHHHEIAAPQHAVQSMADGIPALGIVAAVLGVIHAMGALDQSPEVLGGLIGAALVGTFGGIFLSYGVMAPVAAKIDVVRTKQLRLYTLVKQSLLAFMNGAMPQVAVEFGRKTIPSKERPTIDTVENETSLGGGGSAVKEAA